MTFLEKKFQGCLKICLRNDLFFVKLKSEQKNFNFFFQFFSSNSQFSSSENDPRKSKIQKKNSVQHLKMYLRYHMPKIRHFWWWEPKNLWPPACIFSLLNIIPQDPVYNYFLKSSHGFSTYSLINVIAYQGIKKNIFPSSKFFSSLFRNGYSNDSDSCATWILLLKAKTQYR